MSDIKHQDGTCSVCNRAAMKELIEYEEIMEAGKIYLLCTRDEDLTADDALRAFGIEADGGDIID